MGNPRDDQIFEFKESKTVLGGRYLPALWREGVRGGQDKLLSELETFTNENKYRIKIMLEKGAKNCHFLFYLVGMRGRSTALALVTFFPSSLRLSPFLPVIFFLTPLPFGFGGAVLHKTDAGACTATIFKVRGIPWGKNHKKAEVFGWEETFSKNKTKAKTKTKTKKRVYVSVTKTKTCFVTNLDGICEKFEKTRVVIS